MELKSLRLPDLQREIIIHPMAASIPSLALVTLQMPMVYCYWLSLEFRRVKVLKMSVAACLFSQEMVCLELDASFQLLREQLQVSKASQPKCCRWIKTRQHPNDHQFFEFI
jgi:hypothetical protein